MTTHDPQMLKGTLSLVLLQLVSDTEDYGFSIVVRLQERGFAELSEGTVYPALTRLETNKLLSSRLVRSASGPARKYYSITSEGVAELARGLSSWHSFVATVSTILPAPTAAPTSSGSTR